MVLGLLALAAMPTTIGTAQAVSENNKKERQEKRTEECHLTVFCETESRKRDQVHGKCVVLRDNKLHLGETPPQQGPRGYPFCGFYVTYPSDAKPLGLVSMVSDDPPTMNWMYVDRTTLEVKYGNRTASVDHVVGPWDWTDDEVGITLEGKEAFVAVEESTDTWALYFDRNGDCSGLPTKKRILEISLERKPKASAP
ncbi:MAG: hypothetical protein M1833_004949 [Piccolia ochrophora]|nr:MAG: hypothetical protein M1833_004949 [Piccolia ochrophora]